MPEKWDKVGSIGVDSGLCWLGDPVHVLHSHSGKAVGKNWAEFCGKVLPSIKDAVQFKYDLGHDGLGVAVHTGYGDGFYPVLVRRTSEGRIAEVKVVFIDE